MEKPNLSQFQVAYEATVEKIYNFVYYRTGRNRDLAEDLTSEIFLKALERFETYDQNSSFQAWIFTIARNHIIDRYRTHKESVRLEDLTNVLSAPKKDLNLEIDEREAVKMVMESIDRLPENHREVLVLKFVNELDNSEIARILDKNQGAVRVAIHRALQALRNILEPRKQKSS
jgi:RNA polymerase sigma-70 factor (ECF subfamily)